MLTEFDACKTPESFGLITAWTSKILCGMWLCTGLFIMVATLLRCILCLKDVDSINVGTIWSIRETVSHQ